MTKRGRAGIITIRRALLLWRLTLYVINALPLTARVRPGGQHAFVVERYRKKTRPIRNQITFMIRLFHIRTTSPLLIFAWGTNGGPTAIYVTASSSRLAGGLFYFISPRRFCQIFALPVPPGAGRKIDFPVPLDSRRVFTYNNKQKGAVTLAAGPQTVNIANVDRSGGSRAVNTRFGLKGTGITPDRSENRPLS